MGLAKIPRAGLPDAQGFLTIDVPWPTQEYVHGDCVTPWAETRCRCGAYALHWILKQAAWEVGEGEEIALLPDGDEIPMILAEAIDGPYRFALHAQLPQVVVSPVGALTVITVRTTPQVQLWGPTRVLHGEGDVLALEIVAAPFTHLVQVGTRPKPKRTKKPLSLLAPRPVRTDAGRVRAAPATPSVLPPVVLSPVSSSGRDLSIPKSWRTFCRQHDVHPTQGHYLVIPATAIVHAGDERPWIVRSPHVTTVEVVKPQTES